VLDYSPFGSLVDLLNDSKSFPELSIRLQVGWVIDLINAVYFIHQKKVKHRDIKADNLLVFSELKVKLCDFGLSKQHSQSRVSSVFGGTQGFMAPEVVAGEGSGFPSDIFSWAMTFYQIVMREYPKVTHSHSQLMGNLLVELEDKLDGVDLGPISSLLTNCFHKSPESRPLAGDVNERMLGFLRSIGGDPRLGMHTGDDEMINELEGQLKKIKKITFVSQDFDGHTGKAAKKAQEAAAELKKAQEAAAELKKAQEAAAELKKAQEAAKAAKFMGICEQTLTGHSNDVLCVVQLADGRVVSGSEDKTLKVWNVNTGVCEMTLEGHRDGVSCLIQLADGRVVSGSDDSTLKVWNVNTGVCEKTLKGHSYSVCCLVQLADGRVVSGSYKTLNVWNVTTGVCERTLKGHSDWVSCLVQLADGRVVSGSDDSTLKVWNMNTGVCEQTLEGHNKHVECLVQLADGRVVSGSRDNALKVWNMNTGVCEMTLTEYGHKVYKQSVCCLVQLADGRVVSGSYKTLKVWNVNTGVCEMTLEGHSDGVECLVQLADGRVVSGSRDKTLKVWK
jgi:hypothetical protein